MKRPSLSSASGLRPTSAFFVIGSVLVAVAGRVAYVSTSRAAAQPDRENDEQGVPPSYRIEGAGGATLAQFVPRFDLVMSPRSMWQAHTPRHMAEKISEVLGGEPDVEDLLQRMLPDSVAGRIEAGWDLSPHQAVRLRDWIDSGDGSGREPLKGLWIDRVARPGGSSCYRLFWQPSILLSQKVRQAHGYSSPWAWARHLADKIDACLRGPSTEGVLGRQDGEARRQEVWARLVPAGYAKPVEGIPGERVLDLRELLAREGVAPWQMKIAYGRDRVYPAGEHELFGSWGFLRPEQTQAEPRSGLELCCDRLLEDEAWAFLRPRAATYTWLADRTVRGQRANGFVSFEEASEPPVVTTSLDPALMRFLRAQLQEVMDRHRPAVAMAIALELASGDVLAVDSLESYDVEPFAPVFHTFTPGSSMKVVTMSIALEEGLVRPDEEFEVGNGHFDLVDPDTGSTRTVHEAEGFLEGRQTAAWCLAGSSNAGLAQIGMRIPAERFRDYLVRLGYGQRPGSGLGSERPGSLTPLPWKRLWTQASVSFGHEMTTTLWQHAEGLSACLRGVHRPLRLIREVRQDDARYPVPAAPGERVFSERTCAEVRDMMRLGAREGTGEPVWRDGIDLATKTGTAEKVPTEVCVHVEMRERERLEALGEPFTGETYRDLHGLAKPHRNCYTSSMCAVGRSPETGREVMVLVVVDEPTGKEKFGSRVAGPAAIAILEEALGRTRQGRSFVPDLLPGFALSSLPPPSSSAGEAGDSEPWRTPW